MLTSKEINIIIAKDNIKHYQYIADSLLLPENNVDFLILRSDIELTGGYISDIASHRLTNQFTPVEIFNNKVVIRKIHILSIRTELFTKRKDIVPCLYKQDYEIAGNVYLIKNYLNVPLFPIDLLNFDHICIKKWKLR